jgi:hypothetical protein
VEELNAASAYFDVPFPLSLSLFLFDAFHFKGGLLRFNDPGEYFFMSTRNNQFTNRSQKGSIVVSGLELWMKILIGVAAGGAFVGLTAGSVSYTARYAATHPSSRIGRSAVGVRLPSRFHSLSSEVCALLAFPF